MDDQLLRGNRTVKSNSSGLDAFESPNFPPLAKLEIGIRVKAGLALAPPMGRFTVHTSLNTNVAVWRSALWRRSGDATVGSHGLR